MAHFVISNAILAIVVIIVIIVIIIVIVAIIAFIVRFEPDDNAAVQHQRPLGLLLLM